MNLFTRLISITEIMHSGGFKISPFLRGKYIDRSWISRYPRLWHASPRNGPVNWK